MKHCTVLLIAMMFIVMSSTAEARGFRFGDDVRINFIEDVTLKGNDSEALFLGYKTTTKFFLLGVYVTDDGYVLGIKGKEEYYDLPADKVTEFQSQGLLPNPLPPYQLATLDYVFGYSLWLALVALLAYGGFSVLRKRTKSELA